MFFYFCVENDIFYVGIFVEIYGWVVIGFGGGFGMRNIDIVIVYVFFNGIGEISDLYLMGFFGLYNFDMFFGGYIDILFYGGCEDENGIVVEFLRLLNIGDGYDYVIFIEEFFRIIWVYGLIDDF